MNEDQAIEILSKYLKRPLKRDQVVIARDKTWGWAITLVEDHKKAEGAIDPSVPLYTIDDSGTVNVIVH